MTYRLDYTEEAKSHLAKLAKDEPKVYLKALRFLEELKEHPKTGLGHPEPLKGQPEGRWSREITKKHRLVYRIFETEVVVLVLAAYGHYEDK
jgi:toxin YoeB